MKINNIKISTYADLTGFLNSKRPKDVVQITYLRNGITNAANVVLSKNEMSKISSLGLQLKNLNKEQLKDLNIKNGVLIQDITNKELMYYGVKKGYVITAINGEKMFSVDDVTSVITRKNKGEVLRIEILNLDGESERYIFK